MNIFFLDRDPVVAAQSLCDKHVVKMILESAQLLSTVHHCYNDDDKELPCYSPYNPMHPCCNWVMSNWSHYDWLYKHFKAQCEEYTFRYNKVHKTQSLSSFLAIAPSNQPIVEWRDPPQVMPIEYRGLNTVAAYRRYYIGEKLRFAVWTKRERPVWCYDRSSDS